MATAYETDESSIVEFQLGNKQLFLLFLGLLVICAIFFFIGLRVGEDTAQARIPVNLSDSSSAEATDSGQTLALQPLGTQQQQQPVKEQADAAGRTVEKPEERVQTNPEPKVTNNQASQPKTEQPSSKPEPRQQKPAAVASTGIFVQLVATTDARQAQQILSSVTGPHATQIQKATVNGKVYNRVLVGPFKSKDEAGRYKESIKGKYKGAFINIVR